MQVNKVPARLGRLLQESATRVADVATDETIAACRSALADATSEKAVSEIQKYLDELLAQRGVG